MCAASHYVIGGGNVEPTRYTWLDYLKMAGALIALVVLWVGSLAGAILCLAYALKGIFQS